MNSNPKLSYAIASILAGSPAAVTMAATATATDTSSSDSIEEITVTAQRRSESIQDAGAHRRAARPAERDHLR